MIYFSKGKIVRQIDGKRGILKRTTRPLNHRQRRWDIGDSN
jgi:hypothetical protein